MTVIREDTQGWIPVPAELVMDRKMPPASKLLYLMIAQFDNCVIGMEGWEERLGYVIGLPISIISSGIDPLLATGWAEFYKEESGVRSIRINSVQVSVDE